MRTGVGLGSLVVGHLRWRRRRSTNLLEGVSRAEKTDRPFCPVRTDCDAGKALEAQGDTATVAQLGEQPQTVTQELSGPGIVTVSTCDVPYPTEAVGDLVCVATLACQGQSLLVPFGRLGEISAVQCQVGEVTQGDRRGIDVFGETGERDTLLQHGLGAVVVSLMVWHEREVVQRRGYSTLVAKPAPDL